MSSAFLVPNLFCGQRNAYVIVFSISPAVQSQIFIFIEYKLLTSYFDHFTDVHFHAIGRIVDIRKKSFLNFPVFQKRILFRPIGETVRAWNMRRWCEYGLGLPDLTPVKIGQRISGLSSSIRISSDRKKISVLIFHFKRSFPCKRFNTTLEPILPNFINA